MSAEDDRKARLASALRANLARRKAQGRARTATPDAPDAGVSEPGVLEPGGGDAGAGARDGGDADGAREGLGKGRIVPPGGAR